MKSKKTNKEWKDLVFMYNDSGQNMTEFSKNNKMNASTFIYWVKKFNKTEPKIPKLVKIPVNQVYNLEPIQISINRIKIEVPGDMSSDKITKLLSAIREVI